MVPVAEDPDAVVVVLEGTEAAPVIITMHRHNHPFLLRVLAAVVTMFTAVPVWGACRVAEPQIIQVLRVVVVVLLLLVDAGVPCCLRNNSNCHLPHRRPLRLHRHLARRIRDFGVGNRRLLLLQVKVVVVV